MIGRIHGLHTWVPLSDRLNDYNATPPTAPLELVMILKLYTLGWKLARLASGLIISRLGEAMTAAERAVRKILLRWIGSKKWSRSSSP